MGRPAKYPEEFRREAVEFGPQLGPSSSRGSQVARDLRREPGVVAERPRSTKPLAALDPTERAELERLRKENKDLRMDRAILRNAAAYLARETFK